MKAEFI